MFNINTSQNKVRVFRLRQIHTEGHQVKEVITAKNPQLDFLIGSDMPDEMAMMPRLWMGVERHTSSINWWWMPETLRCKESGSAMQESAVDK